MRVHTNRPLAIFGSYLKLGLSLAILYVIASQAFKYWQQDPGIQQIQQLNQTETVQP
jgi:hypothetical protein